MHLLRGYILQDIFKLPVFIFLIIVVNILLLVNQQASWKNLTCVNEPLWDKHIDFETAQINNEIGTVDGCYIVPNYVHFVKFGDKNMSYVEMIVMLAALKNQRPDKIFIHRNLNNTPTGKYWNILMGIKTFTDVLVLNYVEKPKEIYGQAINSKHSSYHASDITRIRMLMKYGGIYLDGDTYLVKSLNDFRRYEMTLNWGEGQSLGNQLFIAHKDARFLNLYLETYRGHYKKDLWYYNAGERPTNELLRKRPEVVHRVKVKFGADNKFILDILQKQWKEWKNMYAIHLLIRHQGWCKALSKKAKFPVEFNEHNIAYYPVTFREMAYDVYDFGKLPWPKEYKS